MILTAPRTTPLIQSFQYVPLLSYIVISFERALGSRLEVTPMLLDTIFAPFVKERPICVMARAILDQRAHLRRHIRLCVTPCPTTSCMAMKKRANIVYLI